MKACSFKQSGLSRPFTAPFLSGIAATGCSLGRMDVDPSGWPRSRQPASAYGERPMGVSEADGLFSLRLRRESWMIVGVSAQGCDDRDRPGALAFHALFLDAWTYWWSGGSPFSFRGELRRTWSSADRGTTLPSCGRISPALQEVGPISKSCPMEQARITQTVAALSRGRRVVVHSPEPIDTLAQEVWHVLPRASDAGPHWRHGRTTTQTNLTWSHFPSWLASL